jgi:hypothetical protein
VFVNEEGVRGASAGERDWKDPACVTAARRERDASFERCIVMRFNLLSY